jgi:hypothetical protein
MKSHKEINKFWFWSQIGLCVVTVAWVIWVHVKNPMMTETMIMMKYWKGFVGFGIIAFGYFVLGSIQGR